MKNSITVKLIAVLLCAVALLGAAGSAVCFLGLEEVGALGSRDASAVRERSIETQSAFLAEELARNWASEELGGIPSTVTTESRENLIENWFHPDKVYYTVRDGEGNILTSTYSGESVEKTYTQTFEELRYERLWDEAESEALTEEAVYTADEAATASMSSLELGEEDFDPTEATTEYTEAIYDYGDVQSTGYYSNRNHRWVVYNYVDDYLPACEVTVYLAEDAALEEPGWELLEILIQKQSVLFRVLIASGVAFAVTAVYLCTSAGHGKKSEEIRAGGLNALPLDLYGLTVLAYGVGCVLVIDDFGRNVLEQSLKAAVYALLGMGFFGSLLMVGFCFAFAAQVKTKGYYWFWNSLCGRCIRLSGRLLGKLGAFLPRLQRRGMQIGAWGWRTVKRLFATALTICTWLLALAKQIFGKAFAILQKWLGWLGRKMEHFLSLLPLTWQWLLGGFALIAILMLTVSGRAQQAVLGMGICVAMVLYVSGAFGTLLEAVQRMRGGDLESKVDDRFLVGSFKDFAEELNGLADVAMVSAQKQLKSERMKTELITNVSHDIKTPLTSIINYVDLLAKPHTEEEEKTYLEVLSRQSARMKKLIEDLIEMSKATTGNIPVEITEIDAVEAVNQALGEFADKLDAARLTPVFKGSEAPMMILADGRLLWRAMSNVLSNAVKYAMPGTRVYLDVTETDSNVLIALKNISRAELNVSSEELLERFVRGDAARNTEGSGLGLNIAKSLMELQKGQLELLVDGDLFKVTLVFPRAEK